jgi:hypothetical protein
MNMVSVCVRNNNIWSILQLKGLFDWIFLEICLILWALNFIPKNWKLSYLKQLDLPIHICSLNFSFGFGDLNIIKQFYEWVPLAYLFWGGGISFYVCMYPHALVHAYSVIVIFVNVSGVRLCLWTTATNWPIIHSLGDIWVCRAMVEWYWQGKREELGEKPVPVPLCPPQIPHGLTQSQTRAFVMRGWWHNCLSLGMASVIVTNWQLWTIINENT